MGTGERIHGLTVYRDEELEASFPHLAERGYQITSPKDASYNCVAWAVGDTSRFWYDVKVKGYYWPPGAGSADTVEGWKQVFTIHGYSETDSDELEDGFEKVAIYVDGSGDPSHVARQTEDGSWTSKLGKGFDIRHETLDSLENEEYGKATVIMRRPCKDGKRVRTLF